MSVKITGKYLGHKRVEMQHGPSGAMMITDAPKDNNGEGRSFSPTDLLASSLAACMLTIMGIHAEKNGLELAGTHFELEKNMSASPRRVGSVPIVFHLPGSIEAEARAALEEAGLACPVHQSLHADVQITVDFQYDV